jgi:hypothetical protein
MLTSAPTNRQGHRCTMAAELSCASSLPHLSNPEVGGIRLFIDNCYCLSNCLSQLQQLAYASTSSTTCLQGGTCFAGHQQPYQEHVLSDNLLSRKYSPRLNQLKPAATAPTILTARILVADVLIKDLHQKGGRHCSQCCLARRHVAVLLGCPTQLAATRPLT